MNGVQKVLQPTGVWAELVEPVAPPAATDRMEYMEVDNSPRRSWCGRARRVRPTEMLSATPA